MASNSSVTSVLANAKYAGVSIPPQVDQVVDQVYDAVASRGPWALVFSVLALLVAYDQSKTMFAHAWTARVRLSVLTMGVSVVMYIVRKGSIVGPAMKLPFMGPFLQSVNPKFEEYYAKWVSGPLSCVSVFHKYVCSLYLPCRRSASP